MTTKQIKDINDKFLEHIDVLCNNEDQKRTFLQGARQMAHALSMNDLISIDDKLLITDPIDKKIDKLLDLNKIRTI